LDVGLIVVVEAVEIMVETLSVVADTKEVVVDEGTEEVITGGFEDKTDSVEAVVVLIVAIGVILLLRKLMSSFVEEPVGSFVGSGREKEGVEDEGLTEEVKV
jgi:hypothetical protein